MEDDIQHSKTGIMFDRLKKSCICTVFLNEQCVQYLYYLYYILAVAPACGAGFGRENIYARAKI